MLNPQFPRRPLVGQLRRRRFFGLPPLSGLRATKLSVARNRIAQPSSTTQGAAGKSYRALRETLGSFPHAKQLQGAFWTLLDQGTISLGTFLLNIQLARQLDVSEYGIFALLLGGYFLVQHFNASLIYYPMMLGLAAGKEERTSDLIFISVALTAASSFAFSAIVAACLYAFGHSHIAAAAALYLVLWQLQDLLRRALLAEFRHQAAILGDGITYFGAAGAIAVLASYHSLSLVTALFSMSGACALAIAVQAIQRAPIFLRIRVPQESLWTFWMCGKWAFVNGVILIATIQIFPWTLAMLDGPSAAAGFQAVLTIANIANPITFGLGNMIFPAVAQAYKKNSIRNAWRAAKTYIVIGAALLSLYVVPVMIMPRTTLFLFYGEDSPYANLHQAVSIMVLAAAINSVADMMSMFLYGVKAVKLAVWMNGISLGVAALLLPFVGSQGVAACALALSAAKTIRLMTAWRLITRMLSSGVRFSSGAF
jgi:O-antigen/teichoic acid export membrane protein